MKVSIITVTFNSSRTIERTLLSVKSQSYANIEHIIIDGLSEDETIGIVNKFDHVSRVICENDKGIYDAINKGIKIATGDIVGILNSDDVFFDEFVIERIVNEFLGNYRIEAVIAPVVFYDFMNKKVKRDFSISRWGTSYFKYGSMPPHPSFYCYRSLFDEFGFYNTSYTIAGDFDLMLRFFFNKKIIYKKLDFYTNRMSLGGISTKSIRSNFVLNREILLSCNLNGLSTNIFYIYSKYIFKVFQLKL